jgi:hypothetical protein
MARWLKVSLHKTGDWRIQWEPEENPIEVAQRGRIIRQWQRPAEFTPGWTQGPSVFVPATSLSDPLPAFADPGPKVVWLNPPSEGKKLQFTILLSRPGAKLASVRITGHTFQTVGQLKLTNGDKVWLTVHETDLAEWERETAETHVRGMRIHVDDPNARMAGVSVVEFPAAQPHVIVDVALGAANISRPEAASPPVG